MAERRSRLSGGAAADSGGLSQARWSGSWTGWGVPGAVPTWARSGPATGGRAAILGRVPAALAPGGTAFALGFDLANLTEGTGRPVDPDVLYTPEAVSAELSGLRIVRAERLYYSVTRDDGPATTVATVVRAVRD